MRMRKYIFIGQYTLFCSLFFYGLPNVEAISGTKVKPAAEGSFPFIAGISKRTATFNPSRDMICTAALITQQDILTAEHCLTDEVTGAIQVLVGSINLWASSIFYPSWWISYDLWASINKKSNEYGINDVCILRLVSPVNTTHIAKLKFLQYGDLKGKSVIAVGWGEIKNQSTPMTLQTAKLKILSNSDCARRCTRISNVNYEVNKNLLCSVADPYALLMKGDSGGPVMYKDKIVAVNSGTSPITTTFHPDKVNLHTNLCNYKAFWADITSS